MHQLKMHGAIQTEFVRLRPLARRKRIGFLLKYDE